MTIYRTQNSVYEVDEAGSRVRRLEGKNLPTQYQAEDGEWQPVEDVARIGVGPGRTVLLFHWGDGRSTITSHITEIGDPA